MKSLSRDHPAVAPQKRNKQTRKTKISLRDSTSLGDKKPKTVSREGGNIGERN